LCALDTSCGTDDPNDPGAGSIMTPTNITYIARGIGDGAISGIDPILTNQSFNQCFVATLGSISTVVVAARGSAIIRAIIAAAEAGELVPGLDLVELAGLLTVALAAILAIALYCGLH
jgi:hypothetical protein